MTTAIVEYTLPPTEPPSRPTDEAIIGVLALHYHVHESTVIAWLLEVDLDAAEQHLLKEFSLSARSADSESCRG